MRDGIADTRISPPELSAETALAQVSVNGFPPLSGVAFGQMTRCNERLIILSKKSGTAEMDIFTSPLLKRRSFYYVKTERMIL